MQITPFTIKDFKPIHWQAWDVIQRTHSELSSPHFSSQFVRSLAEVRSGVEVAVLSEQGQVVGFFPYHRSGRLAEPVGGTFSDLQGLIAPADIKFEPRQLLRACGLSRIAFTDMLQCQTVWQPFHSVEHQCPYLDLSQGFDAYAAGRRAVGTDELKQTMRKQRKADRDVAPLRFEFASRDPSVLDSLLSWKQRQLDERKLRSPFSVKWPRELMTRLLTIENDDFAGMLSVLYVGDHLSAAAMNFRSRDVINYWVTSFEPTYQKFSPGLILLLELARCAAGFGVKRIDLGRGNESYKRSFASGAVAIAEGGVDRSRLTHALRSASFQAREWVRTTPIGQPARQVVERCRYAFSQWKTMQNADRLSSS